MTTNNIDEQSQLISNDTFCLVFSYYAQFRASLPVDSVKMDELFEFMSQKHNIRYIF